jgi:hypothetical protein
MSAHQDQSPFSVFDFFEKRMLYLGLLALEKGSPEIGFANSDQGHPAYRMSKSGGFDYDKCGDSPDRNRLFKMMHTPSVAPSEAELDGSSEISDYVFSWADFRTMAC